MLPINPSWPLFKYYHITKFQDWKEVLTFHFVNASPITYSGQIWLLLIIIHSPNITDISKDRSLHLLPFSRLCLKGKWIFTNHWISERHLCHKLLQRARNKPTRSFCYPDTLGNNIRATTHARPQVSFTYWRTCEEKKKEDFLKSMLHNNKRKKAGRADNPFIGRRLFFTYCVSVS